MFEYSWLSIAPWGIEIIIYFFLIGTAAMTFVVAAGPNLFGEVAAPFKSFQVPGAIIALVLLAVVVPLLIFDLTQPWRFLNTILYLRWTSPLFWGSLFLPLFGLSILGFLYGIYTGHPRIQRISSIFGALLALAMPLYTGLDLMVQDSRELWANPTIPVLFVVLSITSGDALVAVAMLLMGKLTDDVARLLRFILAFSVGVTFWLVLGLVLTIAYGSAQLNTAAELINSEFAMDFWVLGFIVGVIIPGILAFGPMEFKFMNFARSPIVVTVAAVLGAVGSYMLREVIIYTGQLPQLYY